MKTSASRDLARASPVESLLADGAMLATVLAVVLLFGVSQLSLEALGFAYIKTGGSFWEKVHPATPVAMLALVLRCLASGHPLATAKRLSGNDGGVLLYLMAIGVTGLAALAVAKTPLTPLIDTFLLPILFFWLLRDLDERMARAIALILAAILAANALIALSEYFSGWRLVPITVPEGASADPRLNAFDWRASLAADWRATALLGHPIESGGLVGAFILCLGARGSRWLAPRIRLPLLALQILALFAYGSRLALVLAVATVALSGLADGVARWRMGSRVSPRALALAVLAVPVAMAGLALVLRLGLFDRTFERFTNDEGSAMTRLTMFRLFDPLSLHEMLFAPDQDLVQTWKRLEGLEYGIESSWVGLTLTYGLLVTAILACGLVAFTRSVLREAGRGGWRVAAFFFVVVSLATGLAGKTTTLASVTVMILLFVRRDERPSPPRRIA